MRKPLPVVALAVALAAPAQATEPGIPMDCSDLQLAPGLTCTTIVPAPSTTLSNGGAIGTPGAVDNAGNVYLSGEDPAMLEPIGICNGQPLFRRPLLRVLEGGTWKPLIVAEDRCSISVRRETVTARSLHFDAHGSLWAEFLDACVGSPVCQNYATGLPPPNVWLARIDGFTPLADVLPPPPLPHPLCSNGLDDDGDGRTDADDPQCKSDADNDESRP